MAKKNKGLPLQIASVCLEAFEKFFLEVSKRKIAHLPFSLIRPVDNSLIYLYIKKKTSSKTQPATFRQKSH